jgi:hypothetical protein
MLHTYEPMKVGIIQSGAMGLGHDPQIPFEFAQGRRFSRSGSFGMRLCSACLMIMKSCLRLHQHPGVFADSLDGLQDGLHVIL